MHFRRNAFLVFMAGNISFFSHSFIEVINTDHHKQTLKYFWNYQIVKKLLIYLIS